MMIRWSLEFDVTLHGQRERSVSLGADLLESALAAGAGQRYAYVLLWPVCVCCGFKGGWLCGLL